MAHAITKVYSQCDENIGRHTAFRIATYAGNIGTYATGGVAWDPTDGTVDNFAAIYAVLIQNDGAVNRKFLYDYDDGLIKAYTTADGAENAEESLAAVDLLITVFGIGATGN